MKALVTCAWCGQPATEMRSAHGGWHESLCDKHASLHDEICSKSPRQPGFNEPDALRQTVAELDRGLTILTHDLKRGRFTDARITALALAALVRLQDALLRTGLLREARP